MKSSGDLITPKWLTFSMRLILIKQVLLALDTAKYQYVDLSIVVFIVALGVFFSLFLKGYEKSANILYTKLMPILLIEERCS